MLIHPLRVEQEEKIMKEIDPSIEYFVPTREFVQNLAVGDLAPNCFGRWNVVTSIFAQGDDIHGHAYVCYYTEFGANATMSHSLTEGELNRTVPMISRHDSHELDTIERNMVAA
jgi:hypothetical protein